MIYLYSLIGFLLGGGILHLIIEKLAANKVDSYLSQANILLRSGRYTDGCTTPFKTYIHRWLSHSRDLCAAHDYGSLGFIDDVNPGIHNNLITWFAHMSQAAPVYWVWGTIVALVTLPWVVWRRNLNMTMFSFMGFHLILILGGTFFTLYYYFG